jgi:hypothetical protein
MAVRITQVILQVLHQGKAAQENAIGTGAYDHNYTAYDGSVDASFDVEIGFTLQGFALDSTYFLAGFESHESTPGSGAYDLNAYEQIEGEGGSATYVLNAYTELNGLGTVGYKLEAFVELEDQKQGNYALNAFEPRDTVVNSEYELQVFLLAQGYTNGLYSVDVYLDLLMQAVSTYDLNIFELTENVVGQVNYDLLAWEAREQVIAAHYALLTLVQADGYLDSAHQIEAFEALEEKFGVAYDLTALLQLDGFVNSRYTINTLTLAQLQFGAKYDLDIFAAFDGFADATAVLNAYQQENGFTDGQYGINVYLAKNGFVDAQYVIEALQQVTGYGDGTYLLDTTQELFTWVLNHNTGAPSRYENFDFDAFAVIGQDYLAARGDGIYLLDGDDDNGIGIDAIATIGRTDFDEPVLKRVTAAFLGLNSAGQAHITLRTDQGITSGPYKLRQSPTASTTERAKFARGLKSRYWEMDIENADGGDLQVKTAEFETIVLGEKRRLKK